MPDTTPERTETETRIMEAVLDEVGWPESWDDLVEQVKGSPELSDDDRATIRRRMRERIYSAPHDVERYYQDDEPIPSPSDAEAGAGANKDAATPPIVGPGAMSFACPSRRRQGTFSPSQPSPTTQPPADAEAGRESLADTVLRLCCDGDPHDRGRHVLPNDHDVSEIVAKALEARSRLTPTKQGGER